MNFFKLRRTKMLDDAVLDHKPQSILTLLLIFYVVFFVGEVISKIILTIPSTIWMLTYDGFIDTIREYTDSVVAGNKDDSAVIEFINEMVLNMPSWLTLATLVSFVGLGAAAIFYCKKFEKRPLSSMGIRKKGAITESLLGLLIGGALISLTVLFAFLTGSISIKPNESFDFMIILFFIGFLIHAFCETTLFFGYFTTSIARDYKLSFAITVGAVMFSLLHGSTEKVSYLLLINTILFGALLGIYVFKRGDIWGAFSILGMWNFAGGCIFGGQVNGVDKIPSLFIMEIDTTKALANGGSVGIEGGLSTTVALLIAFALIFLLKTKKGEESLSDATDFE